MVNREKLTILFHISLPSFDGILYRYLTGLLFFGFANVNFRAVYVVMTFYRKLILIFGKQAFSMEVNDTPPPEYLDGFNIGYTIAEVMPELAEKLAKAKGNSPKLAGLKQGINEYSLEKDKQLEQNKGKEETTENKGYYPDWIRLHKTSEQEKGITPEKDIDKNDITKE